jgi:hypothetical protein
VVTLSDVWYVAFGLIAVIALTTALLLIAALRQIGLLYEQIRNGATSSSTVDGLEPGRAVPVPELDSVTAAGGEPFVAPVSIMAYVQPRCAACQELPRRLVAYMSANEPEVQMEVFAVTDMDVKDTDPYVVHVLAESELPLYRSPGIVETLGIPGSPFLLVVDRATPDLLRVLAAGIAGEEGDVESLIGEALEFREVSGRPVLDPESGPSAMKLPLHTVSDSNLIVTPARKMLAEHRSAKSGMETS